MNIQVVKPWFDNRNFITFKVKSSKASKFSMKNNKKANRTDSEQINKRTRDKISFKQDLRCNNKTGAVFCKLKPSVLIQEYTSIRSKYSIPRSCQCDADIVRSD